MKRNHKTLFPHLWALWGGLTFITSFLITFILSMLSLALPGKTKYKAYQFFAKAWMDFWHWISLTPVKITGKDNFKKGEYYIVTFNHRSLLDPTISAPYIPGPNKTIGKSSFTKAPIFGWYYRISCIIVDRKDTHSKTKSFEAMKKVLDSRTFHMSIYPEGTRNKGNIPIKPFYGGAFHLSKNTGTPIIPAIITGTGKAMPAGKIFYLSPRKLGLHFLPPVFPQDYPNASELSNEVHKRMTDAYIKLNQAQ